MALDHAQIGDCCFGVATRETKSWHVGMTRRQAVAQSSKECIEIEPPIEFAEWRSADMRACSGAFDRMAARAHFLQQSMAALFTG